MEVLSEGKRGNWHEAPSLVVVQKSRPLVRSRLERANKTKEIQFAARGYLRRVETGSSRKLINPSD
jgi:hypothetical protein